MILRELITLLSYEVDEAQLEAADRGLQQLQKGAERVADAAENIGKKLTLYVTAPLLAMAGVSVYAAEKTNDALEKVQNTFQSVGADAAVAGQRIAKAYGLSDAEANNFLATTGKILQNFGLTEGASLTMSEQIQGMSADLAAFNKLEGGAARATQIITAALAGQSRGLRELGIVLDETEIKQKILQMAQAGATFSSARQAEVLATLALIQERTGKAAGAYQKTMQQLGPTLQRIQSGLARLADSFGKIMLPAIEVVARAVERFIGVLTNMNTGVKTFLVVLGAFLAILGPLALGLATVAGAMGLFAAASLALTPILTALNIQLLPLLGYFALIAAAIVATILVLEDLYTFIQGGESVFGNWVNGAMRMLTAFAAWFQTFTKPITDFFDRVAAGFGNVAGVFNNVATRFSQAQSGMTASPASVQSSNSNSLSQSNAIRIQVDASGNSNPTQTTEAVRTGVESGLASVLRGASQNFSRGRAY